MSNVTVVYLNSMLNVLLLETKSAIYRQTATSEVIVCTYGCATERLYDEQGNEAEVWYFKSPSMIYEILNKQVKFLTSQYIGTCKSAYTKGYALN